MAFVYCKFINRKICRFVSGPLKFFFTLSEEFIHDAKMYFLNCFPMKTGNLCNCRNRHVPKKQSFNPFSCPYGYSGIRNFYGNRFHKIMSAFSTFITMVVKNKTLPVFWKKRKILNFRGMSGMNVYVHFPAKGHFMSDVWRLLSKE